jgi:hypothetical protein
VAVISGEEKLASANKQLGDRSLSVYAI